MNNILKIQMLGMPRSGTNFLKELVLNNSLDNSLQFFDDHDPCKHNVYPPPLHSYKNHFENINIILLIYKDICSWIESNLIRWQDFDLRFLNGDIIDVYEKTSPELTIVNDNVMGHYIGDRAYNLTNIIKIYNLFHNNWLVNNFWFNFDSKFKNKMVIVPYEDLLVEENIVKLFDVLKSKGIKTKGSKYTVPKLGEVHLSQRNYPEDHLEKYKNKTTTVLTEYQKQYAYDLLDKDFQQVVHNLKNYQF